MRVLFILTTAILSLPTIASAQRTDAVQATLLHKGDDQLIHAVPLNPGYTIVCTSPSTGVMKPLIKVQPRQIPERLDRSARPVSARRFLRPSRTRTFRGDLVAGVALDEQRLYVLTASRIYKLDGNVKGNTVNVVGHNFHLHAFWLKDGAPLTGRGYQLPLVSYDSKSTAPPDTKNVSETLGQGPLKLVESGIACRGTTLLFKDKSVAKVDVQGKQFTPPPDLFNPRPRIG